MKAEGALAANQMKAAKRAEEAARTIRGALAAAAGALAASDSPALDAQVLLSFVLGCGRAHLFAHGDEPLSAAQNADYAALLARRAAGEPIAYIVGRRGFYDREFAVSPAVLIPRPETELLLEEALRLTRGDGAGTAADIGTGSGALAITFAAHRPDWRVYGLDISRPALQAARANAPAGRLDWLQGDLGQPLLERGIRVDLLMANLPYIPTAVLERLAVGRYEPRLALDGGADGLDCIRALLAQVPALCRPGAAVLLEIGAEQGAAVGGLVAERLGIACEILPDYAGFDRIVRFRVL